MSASLFTNIIDKIGGGLSLTDKVNKLKDYLKTTLEVEKMTKERDIVFNRVNKILDKLEGVNSDSLGLINTINELVPVLTRNENNELAVTTKGLGVINRPLVKETQDDAQVFSGLANRVSENLIRVTSLDKKDQGNYQKIINNTCIEIHKLLASNEIQKTINNYNQENTKLGNRVIDFMSPMDIQILDNEINKVMTIDELISRLKRNNMDTDFINSVKSDISNYNKKIVRYKKTTDLPDFYFDGSYTTKIQNNVITRESLNGYGLDIENAIIDPNLLYKPDFRVIQQIGGGDNNSTSTSTSTTINYSLDELKSLSQKLINSVKELYKVKKQHNQLINDYNKWHIRYTFHNLYLVLCASNQIVTKDYTVYRFMNKGILRYLSRGLTTMSNYLDEGINSQSNQTLSNAIEYLRKYHFITIRRLITFTKKIDDYLLTQDIIDIQGCSEKVKGNFHLLSHFKTIIDKFNSINETGISIFVRINDWGETDSMFFKANKEDYKILDVSNCQGDMSKIKFTEVFGSDFSENGVLSNYMALQSVVSDDKGVVLMSYGYSGVGKTFTLFGDGRKQGILQSTLESINGLSGVKFRLFELYGKGVAYPHYWSKGLDNINQSIISYDIILQKNRIKIQGTKTIDAKHISDFISQRNALSIDKSDVENTFKDFASFVKDVEKTRQSLGTVKKTPNNPVSSRSILIYDFSLFINDKASTLLIIDLPGREDIIETYVNMNSQKENILIQLFASISPLALPIVFREGLHRNKQIPYNIISYFNSLPNDTRKKIINTKLEDSFTKKSLGKKVSIIKQGYTRKNERYYPEDLADHLYVDILNETISQKQENDEIVLTKLSVYFAVQMNKFIEINDSFKVTKYTNRHYIKDSPDTYFQYESLLAIHIINRLILMNMHKEIKEITKKILDFDSELPMEGIYINENITGIIKYLIDKANEDTNSIRKQNTDLTFKNQLEEIRNWVINLYTTNDNRLKYNQTELDKLMSKMLGMYKSNAIFNFDKPVITDVLEPYINKIDDYKVLYLLTNKKDKCDPQIRLLNDTRNFIETVTKRI